MNIKTTERAMVLSPNSTVSPELLVCWIINHNTPIIMVRYYAHQLILLLFYVLFVSVFLSYPSLYRSPSLTEAGRERLHANLGCGVLARVHIA